jgi:TPR repeat protein
MRELLRSAASGGHVRAQLALGFLMLNADDFTGGKIRRDECEAIHWFREASKRGSDTGAAYYQIISLSHRKGVTKYRCANELPQRSDPRLGR